MVMLMMLMMVMMIVMFIDVWLMMMVSMTMRCGMLRMLVAIRIDGLMECGDDDG